MSATELLPSSSFDDFQPSPIDATLLINYPPSSQQGTKTVESCASSLSSCLPGYLRHKELRGRKLPGSCMRIGKML